MTTKPDDTSKVPMPGPAPPVPPPDLKPGDILISFKSGHYKRIRGTWKGDSVWGHFYKKSGGMVHINKDEVEYIETFDTDQIEYDVINGKRVTG